MDTNKPCRNVGVINPFSTSAPLLHPLKTSENRRFSDVFRGYRSGTLVENGLTITLIMDIVCVCVCLYSSTVKASSVCKMSDTCLRVRINDVVLYYTQCRCQVPSSQYLKISYFTSKDENSSERELERKRM